MFAKFRETVKDEYMNKIPKEVLAAYNAQIPENVRAEYVDRHDGTCELVPAWDDPKTKMTFTVPSAELLTEIPDDIKTQEELEDYMYRTQKTLHYRVGENAYMNINGFKVYLKDFVKSPFDQYELTGAESFYIIPRKFPELSPLPLVAGDVHLELKVKRIPDERKNIVVLQTDEKFWLQLTLELSTIKDAPSTIRMAYQYQHCKTVSELLCAFRVTDALAEGNYMLPYMESPIPFPRKNPIPADVRQFWEKAEEVEKRLSVSFDPNAISYHRDRIQIEKLYQGLILKRPFSASVNESAQTGLHTTGKGAFEENIGKPMAISYVEKKEWSILGVSFETYDLCCIFDAVISDIEEESLEGKESYFVHLSSVEGKTMRLVTYIARSEEEILEYQRQFTTSDELMKCLSEAKSISE